MRSPQGQFSKLSYEKRGSADGLEPYFIWSDVSGFAQLRKSDGTPNLPEYLPVLLQLSPGYRPSDLNSLVLSSGAKAYLLIEPGYLGASLGVDAGLVPGLVSQRFFDALRREADLRKAIARFELDVPQASLPDVIQVPAFLNSRQNAAVVASKASLRSAATPSRAALEGTVIAFIDDGCPFAHANFWTCSSISGSSIHDLDLRVKRYWDMNERANSSPHFPPAMFATELYAGENGREFTDSDLIQIMSRHVYNSQVSEDAVYADMARGTKNNINRMLKFWSHGTHVMDLACGPHRADARVCTRTNAPSENPAWEDEKDQASQAPVIFVQLPMRTVQDTTLRGTMQQDVIKALDYILDQCAQADEIIVNLSWGTLAGPHTGSNMLEREIDARITASNGRLKVVIPAGNGAQSRTHAHFGLAPSGHSHDTITLNWRNQPDDNTESYLELWMEDGIDIKIDITTPHGDVLDTVMPGDVKFLSYTGLPTWPGAQPDVIFAAIYNQPAQNAAQLGPSRGVMLALAPTVNLANTRKTAYHGNWKIKVTNLSNQAATLDGYIERDDSAADTRRGARQSYFDDPNYDRFAIDDDAVPATLGTNPTQTYVRREGSFNSIATGYHTIKVAGVRLSDLSVAEYSPDHHYSGRPQRAHTLIAREMTGGNTMLYAMSEESTSLPGVRAAGTRSGCSVRLAGTSLSAPQIVRDLANGWLVSDLLP